MIGLKKPPAQRFDSLESLLGYNLRRLSVLTMADLAHALTPLGLKPTEASVLFTVGSTSGLTQSDVGKTLGILRANMTPLVAGMMKRDILEREALDGRSQALRLSTTGRVLHRQAWKVVKAHEERVFGMLSPSARSRLALQLRAMWER